MNVKTPVNREVVIAHIHGMHLVYLLFFFLYCIRWKERKKKRNELFILKAKMWYH